MKQENTEMLEKENEKKNEVHSWDCIVAVKYSAGLMCFRK